MPGQRSRSSATVRYRRGGGGGGGKGREGRGGEGSDGREDGVTLRHMS